MHKIIDPRFFPKVPISFLNSIHPSDEFVVVVVRGCSEDMKLVLILGSSIRLQSSSMERMYGSKTSKVVSGLKGSRKEKDELFMVKGNN